MIALLKKSRMVWLLVSALVLVNAMRTAADDQRPNILFIMTDQQHAEMMSCAGNRYLHTPALDSLAHEGVRFANTYVTNPVCVPSRISMATGVMAGRLGVLTNGMRAQVPEEIATNSLGRLLKQAGYATFYGGKTHLCPELEPRSAGYDEFFADSREALPRACIEFIKRQPFFAVASFINPHDICYAYQAYQGVSSKQPSSVEHLYRQAAELPLSELPALPANYEIPEGEPGAIDFYSSPNSVTPSGIMREKYDERQWRNYRWIYCRLTEQADRQIGEILTALKQLNLDQKTLIVFTSDHGDMDACHRLASKGRFYEQSVRVPMLLKYAGHAVAGLVDDKHLVSSGLDILPTLCDYAGIDIPETAMGRSLRTIASGDVDSGWRNYIVTENQTGRMLRTARYKYCVYNEGELRESLVDLVEDPGEMKNLALSGDSQRLLDEHRQLLQQWIEETDDRDAKTYAF
jgi:arylsulfatase A-like enzyme